MAEVKEIRLENGFVLQREQISLLTQMSSREEPFHIIPEYPPFKVLLDFGLIEKCAPGKFRITREGRSTITGRFISPCPLPNAYQREVINILIEECSEVIQRATKLLRFGADEVQPGQALSNSMRLSLELGDLAAMIDMARDHGLIDGGIIEAQKPLKRVKVAQFMQSKDEADG